jgi:pectate lyase
MLNTTKFRVAVLFAATLICSNVLAELPVIPGAAGFGMNTPAGRGGRIIRVTNLNDGGAGSLRACVEASGPRVCIFEVSGSILLRSMLTVADPYLTIAGQTAPAPGIMLRGASLRISSSDVLVQHLALRAGDDREGTRAETRDSLKINGARPLQNVVIDHCSLSWSVDENLETYKDWDNVTISNTIISEPLRESIVGAHGHSALIGSTENDSKISLIGNLFAHGHARNPRSRAASFVFVNNVVYNPGDAAVMLYNRKGIRTENSIVGNVFIDGPDTNAKWPIRLDGSDTGKGWNSMLSDSRVYVADNVAPRATADPWSIIDNHSRNNLSKIILLSTPRWPEHLKAMSTGQNNVLDYVLKNAGSRPNQRDVVDSRIISDVKNGTGQIINCVADDGSSRCRKNGGGWPKLAENTRRLDVPSDPNGDDDHDGYTNLEEWLHDMSAQVGGRGSSMVPDEAPPKPPVLTD